MTGECTCDCFGFNILYVVHVKTNLLEKIVCQASSNPTDPVWVWLCISIAAEEARYCSATFGRGTTLWCLVIRPFPARLVKHVAMKNLSFMSTACSVTPLIVASVSLPFTPGNSFLLEKQHWILLVGSFDEHVVIHANFFTAITDLMDPN